VQCWCAHGGSFTALLLTSVAASGHNDAEPSIELLLQAGAAVDAVSNCAGIRDRTALMVACSLQLYLRCGSFASSWCRSLTLSCGGITALRLAAAAAFTDMCRALYNASSSVLELRCDGGTLSATLLIAAVPLDQFAVVKLLCLLDTDDFKS
jgi:hypothetical protein